MAALSASVSRSERNNASKKTDDIIVESGVQVYKGSLLYENSSSRAALCADLGAAGNFLGVAEEEVLGDNVKTVKYAYDYEVPLAYESGVTYAYINKAVFAYTDNGITEASTVGPCVGVLKEIDSTLSLAWVHICGAAMAANT